VRSISGGDDTGALGEATALFRRGIMSRADFLPRASLVCDLVRFNRVMRVVLATMGSWGDIFPVIGLAKGLTQAGHDAHIAASPAYAELVQGEDWGFQVLVRRWVSLTMQPTRRS
jgi:Glycosyltransferase family 28 N-terminal domain